MNIAIHISDAVHIYPEPFNAAMAMQMANRLPQHQFHFIYDNPGLSQVKLPENVRSHVLTPAIKGKLSLAYWYRFRMNAFIKKQHIDLLIPAGNIWIGKSAMAQAVIMHDRNSLKKSFKMLAGSKRNEKDFGAVHHFRVCRSSDPGRNKSIDTILYPGNYSRFKKPEPEERELIREKYAAGREYFIYVAANRKDPHFKMLLKAFSVFRKWQKSSMMLLVICQDGSTPEFPELSSYMHRDFVMMKGLAGKKDYEKVIGSAYAGINFACNGLSDPLLEMMHAGVPVITADHIENRRWFDEACLYCKPDADSLAQQLIKLYKDEALKNEMAGRGTEIAESCSWENAAGRMLEKAAPAIFA